MAGAFLTGYNQQRQLDQQNTLGGLQQTTGVLSLQNTMRQQAEQDAVRGVLAQSPSLDAALPQLMKIGPTGVSAAMQLAQVQQALKKQSLGQAIGAGGLLKDDGTVIPPAARPETPKPTPIGAGGLLMPDQTVIPPAARPDAKPQEKWSEPYQLGGAMVQKNEATGQIRTAVTREPQVRVVNPPAPTMTEVVDPSDPTRLLRVDAKSYRGGSLGSIGVLGVSGKEPTAARREEKTGIGREDVSKQVAQLRDYYNQLNESGSITNPDSGTIANLGASISSSALGQMAGRATGTKAQSIRNAIAQQRPLLLQAIKEATGMSAKQMDSNA